MKSYGKKGENIVNMNYAAVDRGADYVKVEIPAEWKNLEDDGKIGLREDVRPDFIKNIVDVVNDQKGDDLPVSAFKDMADGTFPAGTARYEKRGIASHVPAWISSNCIQCNQCSYVCPHAAIRPFVMNAEEVAALPAGTETIKAIGKEFEGMQLRVQVSVLDCTGCGNCVDICPAKEKALVMRPVLEQEAQAKVWNHMVDHVSSKQHLVKVDQSVKNSQFAQPLFEFSGACAGCGETPYIKLITQLFGDRMMVANATGCSSIYSGSFPSSPYCKNACGKGPAWANSLFEDNAEFGLGMATAVRQMRDRAQMLMEKALADEKCPENIKELFRTWIAGREDAQITSEVSPKILEALKGTACPTCKQIADLGQYLIKKSQWIFGGDGWAYDIGYGGLDHVLASGENVNVLVLDTEVYSNTGGQASKSTP
ncbi:MAG: 4Fe-4S dicluster domain-containing protein, partial [Bacteroidales bacterium]|nr:4Fe-4S dicluster domain-containing protein [Bacteroidales bacterium]